MRICYTKDSFIRHISNKSMLWNKRNSACLILQDAATFLKNISFQWKDTESIINAITKEYEAETKQLISADFCEFVAILQKFGFVDVKEENTLLTDMPVSTVQNTDDENEAGEYTPLGSFFEEFNVPAELHIDLTSACTERCVHCYIPEYNNTFLDYELTKKVLREFREIGGLHVHLTGGECMLHPRFEDIVRYCRSMELNIVVMSNLTLCDDSVAKLLQETNPWFVNVSLYSMNPEQHEAITNLKGSWQKTTTAIQKLENAGVACRIAAPVLKENMKDYCRLADYARKHRMHLIPECDIIPQSNMDSDNVINHALSPEELETFMQQHKDLCDKGYPYSRDTVKADNKLCDIGKSRLYVNSKGEYYPCDGMHEYVLGNVADNTLSEIWNGEKLQYLRNLKNRDIPECLSCKYRRYCKVCPANNFNATGDIFKHSDIVCAYAKVRKEIYGVK